MKERVLTALVLGLPTLFLISLPYPIVVSILGVGIALLCLQEVKNLVHGVNALANVAFIAVILCFLGYFLPHTSLQLPLVLGLVAAQVLLLPLGTKGGGFAKVVALSIWVAIPLATLILLNLRLPGPSSFTLQRTILLLLFPQWIGDIAAIFVGRKIGGKLLAPSISPKKTISGSIGNIIGCVLAAWGIGIYLQLPTWLSLSVGAIQGTLGQIGDLYESALKRQVDLKDSSGLLPGHGGILDRVDSLLLSAPSACALVLIALGK